MVGSGQWLQCLLSRRMEMGLFKPWWWGGSGGGLVKLRTIENEIWKCFPNVGSQAKLQTIERKIFKRRVNRIRFL